MYTIIKKQSLFSVTRYLLLPVMILGVAILLSRCGGGTASAPTYQGASLVGQAIISYDKATNTLAIQNFNAPNVTPATGGVGPTVSIYSVAAPVFNGSTVSGQVYIKNASTNPALTGVVVVLDRAMSGSVTVANANYGNGFRANAPTQGPWTWWFYTGTFPNYNIPSNGQSNNVTWTFNATASFAVAAYIYAYCPSGVVVNRVNFANTAVANAFVMLGNSPGDPKYIAEPGQGSNAVNYLAATDANGYFALPITTVIGSTITYTVGAMGTGSGINAQFANFTLWASGLSNVILPIRTRYETSAYVAVGSSAGVGNVTNPAGILTGNCQANYMQIGALLPAMGFEDLINLSLASILGPSRGLSVIGGTNCGANDLTTTMSLPSNLIVPNQNNGQTLAIYTSATGSTANLAMETMATATQGKDFDIAVAANTGGLSVGGIFGNLPTAQLLTLTQAMSSTGNPSGLMSVLTQVQWLSFGWSRNLGPYAANATLPAAADNISRTTTAYALTFANLTTIGGPQDPAINGAQWNVIALPGLAMATNSPLQMLTTMSLPVGTVSAPPANMRYLPGTDIDFPADGIVIPTAFIVDLNSVTANFSASTILADRTGYKTLPGTLNLPFSKWYKLIDLQWPQINPANQAVVWTDAMNTGVALTAPTLSYVAINYGVPTGYTDLYGSAQSINANVLQWEIVGAGPEAANPVTGMVIPTLPATSPGVLVVQPTNSRHYTVNLLQGMARVGVNLAPYVWDSNNNIAYVVENDFLASMDMFSLTKFHVGGGWIITPANGATGLGTSTAGKAYINAYNWNIVSQGNTANLRGCFWVYNNLTKASVWSNCATGTANCAGMPGITVAAPYASQSATLTLASGVYSAITFTPYNTTAGVSSGGSPACQQVGDSATIYVHN